MKIRVYLRVAKPPRHAKGPKLAVSAKPNHRALTDANDNALPTVAFAIELEVPDAMFKRADTVLAELALRQDDVSVAAEAAQA